MAGIAQYYQNRRSSGTGAAPTPENFDRSLLMNGGSHYASQGVRDSWENSLRSRRAAGQTTMLGWQGGKFGWAGGVGTPWRAFQQQPTASPRFITDPAGYQRDQLTSEYQTAMDEARAATEGRYQEALGNLDNVGEQERADLNTRFDSSSSAVNQSLVNSGLSGTSVLPSMQRGVERERTGASNRLASSLARERNDIIQSRNDIPPNLAMLQQLMYQQGLGGGR